MRIFHPRFVWTLLSKNSNPKKIEKVLKANIADFSVIISFL